MPTFNQLVKNGRSNKVYKSKTPVLQRGFNTLKNEVTDKTAPQMFKDQEIIYLKELNEEQKQLFIDECNKVLNVVPEFVKLSVLCDKKSDEMLIVLSPTHCQKVFDYLKRIACYLKFIDGNVEIVEDKISKMVLTSVVDYYKKKYVKYAPNRKK